MGNFNRTDLKTSGKHSRASDQSKIIIKMICTLSSIKKISMGEIIPVGHTTNEVKIHDLKSGLLLKIKGQGAVQEVQLVVHPDGPFRYLFL